ncbi:MAG: M23 family metallopeptidase [Bacteroidaceae bacterium]|nr:M23 family metallopeptidase [Bacteroidaceae bacterium]
MKRFFLRTVLVIAAIIFIGMLIPQNLKMPVAGADSNSYNHETFWHEGWGTSIVHKGIDVFAKRGTSVHSATRGIVLLTAEYGKGGKLVLVLGPKWRLHYYAHLDEIKTKPFAFVTQESEIGTVGNTGNAITTPAHLHYGIGTLVPYLWRIDSAPLGWQKMFYLNPIDYLQ